MQTVLPPPEWLYDRLMLVIEPELTTAQMPFLDEKYRGETGEERKERMARYAKAFQHFADLLTGFGTYLYEQSRIVTAERRQQQRAVEQQEQSSALKLADDVLGNPSSDR